MQSSSVLNSLIYIVILISSLAVFTDKVHANEERGDAVLEATPISVRFTPRNEAGRVSVSVCGSNTQHCTAIGAPQGYTKAAWHEISAICRAQPTLEVVHQVFDLASLIVMGTFLRGMGIMVWAIMPKSPTHISTKNAVTAQDMARAARLFAGAAESGGFYEFTPEQVLLIRNSLEVCTAEYDRSQKVISPSCDTPLLGCEDGVI